MRTEVETLVGPYAFAACFACTEVLVFNFRFPNSYGAHLLETRLLLTSSADGLLRRHPPEAPCSTKLL